MKGKITLLATACLFYTSSVFASSHTQEYKDCMVNNSADSVLAACKDKEYNHYTQVITEKLSEIKQSEYFANILKQYSLDEQHKLWEQMTSTYCQYYVIAKSHQGYSDAYNKADCMLERAESYEEWLDSIISNAKSDYKG